MESPNSEKWTVAVNEELKLLQKNQTWNLVERPVNRKILKNRWIFKVKLKADGTIDQYKARLVGKGCSQIHGVDYDETFSQVVRYSSVRTLLA